MINTYLNYKTNTIHVGDYWTWKLIFRPQFRDWQERREILNSTAYFLKEIMAEYWEPSASDEENAEGLFEVFEMEEGHKEYYQFTWCN